MDTLFFFSPKHWATHVCSACLVSTDDKKEDGSSDFPFGEMKLDECLSLPEMEGSYLKFLGECPNAGVSSTSTMVLLLCILLPLVVVVRRNIYLFLASEMFYFNSFFSLQYCLLTFVFYKIHVFFFNRLF